VRSFNPLRAITQVYGDLAKDCWHAQRWQDKIKVWFMPPGWRPADVAERFPKPGFDVNRKAYDPQSNRGALACATVLFFAMATGSGFLLWQAETMDAGLRAFWCAVLIAGLCLVGELIDGRRWTGAAWFSRGEREDEPAI
jgi:hypothetical protein